VSRLVKRYDIAPTDLVVIHDDLDLPTGKIRIREGGGSGGHKGVDSIIAHINTPDFYRIRVGIGRPDQVEATTRERESAVIDYVLSDFTRDEKNLINEAIPTVSQAIVCLLAEGIIAAMNKYN
jgi:PTH1 family peptidyl-tRNA hydrolase